MINVPDTSETPAIVDKKTEKTAAHERAERVAEHAAEKAGKTEQRYDGSHNIFTK